MPKRKRTELIEAANESFSRVLLLGMVYSTTEKAARGQTYRDAVRCRALEGMSNGKVRYKVFTLDSKHPEDTAVKGRHCQANFADLRRMQQHMQSVWPEFFDNPTKCAHFRDIILDYFFSPSGWTAARWTERFFSETLPRWASSGIIHPSEGVVWLPHVSHTAEMVTKYESKLLEFFEIEFESDPLKNPLYRATDSKSIVKELRRCPDNLTNETQLVHLLAHSDEPFIRLNIRPRHE